MALSNRDPAGKTGVVSDKGLAVDKLLAVSAARTALARTIQSLTSSQQWGKTAQQILSQTMLIVNQMQKGTRASADVDDYISLLQAVNGVAQVQNADRLQHLIYLVNQMADAKRVLPVEIMEAIFAMSQAVVSKSIQALSDVANEQNLSNKGNDQGNQQTKAGVVDGMQDTANEICKAATVELQTISTMNDDTPFLLRLKRLNQLSALTCFVEDAAKLVKQPTDQALVIRHIANTKQLETVNVSMRLIGLGVALTGIAMMAVGLTLAVVTLGVSTPLSAAALGLGAGMVALGVGGFGATGVGLGCMFFARNTGSRVANAGHRMGRYAQEQIDEQTKQTQKRQ